MKRTDDSKTLANYSRFQIKETIDNLCGGKVEECKLLANGMYEIKTKTLSQAIKLIQLISLDNQTNVEVSEHNTRNFSKGVIYCNNLREIEEIVTLQELKQDNVIEVKKILKKQQDKLQETGSIIITFASINLPADIKIGYQKINIRPYIPIPI